MWRSGFKLHWDLTWWFQTKQLIIEWSKKIVKLTDGLTFLLFSACLSFSSISSFVLLVPFFFRFSSFLRCCGRLFTFPVSGQSMTSNAIPPLLWGLSVTPPTGASAFILFRISSCFSENETLFSFKIFRLETFLPSMQSSMRKSNHQNNIIFYTLESISLEVNIAVDVSKNKVLHQSNKPQSTETQEVVG